MDLPIAMWFAMVALLKNYVGDISGGVGAVFGGSALGKGMKTMADYLKMQYAVAYGMTSGPLVNKTMKNLIRGFKRLGSGFWQLEKGGRDIGRGLGATFSPLTKAIRESKILGSIWKKMSGFMAVPAWDPRKHPDRVFQGV